MPGLHRHRPPHRARARAAAATAALAGGLLVAACSLSATTVPTTVPVPIPASRMLTAPDLGAGWTSAAANGAPCTGLPSAASALGPGSTVVRLAGPGGTTAVVEYAVRSGSVRTAYARAVGVLQRTAPCRMTMDRKPAGATFDGVLPLPHFGDLSVCMAFEMSTGADRSQAGVEVVRRGPVLLVVATTGPGALDVAMLQHATAVATGRLDA